MSGPSFLRSSSLFWAVFVVALVMPCFAETSPPGKASAVGELSMRAAWGEEGARETLRGLALGSEGPQGDQAALALAATLVEEQRWNAALPLLRRAASGTVAPSYARLLLARAVIEAGLAGDAVSEAREHVQSVLEEADTIALEREARYRALQLATRAGAWGEAADLGRRLLSAPPAPAHLDEARWLTAESLRLSGKPEEAHDGYRAIWIESPGSPWALEARDRLVAAGVVVDMAPGDRMAWVEALQRHGRHREALEALAPLAGADGDRALRDQATFLASRSHFVLRQNRDVVRLVTELSRRSPRSPWAAQGAVQAMRALARQGHVAEVKSWEAWLRSVHPGQEATHEARFFLGAYLAGEGEEVAPEARAVLSQVASSRATRAPDALWRLAWLERRRGANAAARDALTRLAEEFPDSGFRPAALYWLARLQEAPRGPRARELLHTLRREAPRDYYGLLAVDRLRELGETLPRLDGLGAPLGFDPLRDPERRPEPAYRRGVELRQLGLLRFAAEEIETLDLARDPALDLARIHLRARSGDTWAALGELQDRYRERLAGEPIESSAVPGQVWEVLYPFPYRQAVEEAAARRAPVGHPFDPYLVAAVARNESRFWPRALSPAGAVGILQLLPETAARVARSLGVEPPCREGLIEPALNLEFGTAHLAELVEQFDGSWPAALAAYNAGPGAARRWWRERPEGLEIDEWIETITFSETRIYVKRILADYRIYRQLYGPSPQAPVAPETGTGLTTSPPIRPPAPVRLRQQRVP